MTKTKTLMMLLAVLALGGCEKNAVQDITGALPGSQIKFFNFGVGAPAVNFYANDQKMTAISSTSGTESTNGVAYGAVGSGDRYGAVEPGQYTVSGRISATTDKNLAIANLPATLAQGKAYSAYLSGFYSSASKTVDAFVVEDNFPAARDYTVAYVRFVHAISNAQPMTLFATLQSGGAEVAVGAAVAYKASGAFTAIPGGVYNIATRTAGNSTNAIARTAVSFSAGRVYTISSIGDITITSTTAATRPQLSNSSNR